MLINVFYEDDKKQSCKIVYLINEIDNYPIEITYQSHTNPTAKSNDQNHSNQFTSVSCKITL